MNLYTPPPKDEWLKRKQKQNNFTNDNKHIAAQRFLSVSLRMLEITQINRELLKLFLNSEMSQLSRDLTADRSLHEKRMTSADQWMKNGWLKQNEVKFSMAMADWRL